MMAEEPKVVGWHNPLPHWPTLAEPGWINKMTEPGAVVQAGQPERNKSSQAFHDILKQMGDLHDKKQQDYGRSHDPFFNVRASTEWGMEAWIGAMLRANDKVRRLQKFALDGKLANESVEDAFLDLAVYAVIGLVLYRESK